MTDAAPDWFYDSVSQGLKMLIVLHLAGAPGHETIEYTEQIWVDVLWHAPVQWDRDQDSLRIEKAFRHLARTTDRWPAPQALLKMLPRRREHKAIGRQWTDEQLEANLGRMRQIVYEKLNFRLPNDDKQEDNGGNQ